MPTNEAIPRVSSDPRRLALKHDVRRIHREVTVFLGYTMPLRSYTRGVMTFERFIRGTEDQILNQGSLPMLRRGGVDVAVCSLCPVTPVAAGRDAAIGISRKPKRRLYEPVLRGGEQIKYLLQYVEGFIEAVENSPHLGIAIQTADIERLNVRGKMAVLLHLGGACVDQDLHVLRLLHRLGIRCIHPCCEGLHEVGDASNDYAVNNGLSDFGRRLISEMNRLGILIDVSHASDDAFWEILKISKLPVIASHCNCRALCRVNRNLTDEQIKTIARGGGVVGVHFSSGLINQQHVEAIVKSGFYKKHLGEREQQLRRRYPDPLSFLDKYIANNIFKVPRRLFRQARIPLATLDQLIDHIDHIVGLVGIDYVGIGGDYHRMCDVPEQVSNAGKLHNITDVLLRRGYSEADIKKIWGENFMRVYRATIG